MIYSISKCENLINDIILICMASTHSDLARLKELLNHMWLNAIRERYSQHQNEYLNTT